VSQHYTSTHARPQRSQRGAPGADRPRRLLWLRGTFLLLFLALAGRLFFLQVVDHAYWAKVSSGQVVHHITTTALRAGIYDRDGKIIAISRPTSLVIADDFQVKHPAQEAAELSGLVQVPVDKLTALLSEHSGYVIINNALDLNDGRKVAALVPDGIIVQDSSVRSYPNGTLAQSVVGGTNASGAGSAGLEYEYQKMLAGQTGLTQVLASTSGVNLPSSHQRVIKKAVPGVGLELTLDSSLQYVTEQDLGKEMAAIGGLTGLAVVMDVKTGEILADASLVNTKTTAGILGPIPSWGQNIGIPGIQQTINNLPFSQAYEPGSVFKAVTFSAALQDNLMTPTSVFAIPNSVVVGGRSFHDAENHGLEHLTATQVLAQSSNIGTYEIGKLVGTNGILAQVERLGFGQLTSVGYPGETPGLLVNLSNWYASDAVALPIGQVDAVPAIQVLDAYNAIANGGIFVEPKLVRGYVYANGALQATPKSASRVAIAPQTDATMIKMLEQVVLAGTGTNAIIPGYSVAGKTGTATMPTPGKDTLLVGDYNASFVGFAPANAPVLSMIVVIERPQTTIFGGAVAAPVFQEVMSYALHHYGIPSNGTMVKPLKGSASIASDVT
jgi:cell division protein FtsI (penicillin-binding protein 3)